MGRKDQRDKVRLQQMLIKNALLKISYGASILLVPEYQEGRIQSK